MTPEQIFYLISAVMTALLSWVGLSHRASLKRQDDDRKANALFVRRITDTQDRIADTLENHLGTIANQNALILETLKLQNDRLLNAALRVPEHAEITARMPPTPGASEAG